MSAAVTTSTVGKQHMCLCLPLSLYLSLSPLSISPPLSLPSLSLYPPLSLLPATTCSMTCYYSSSTTECGFYYQAKSVSIKWLWMIHIPSIPLPGLYKHVTISAYVDKLYFHSNIKIPMPVVVISPISVSSKCLLTFR